MDYDMFLQSIMLAAVEQGLASCPQASIAGYSETIKTTLDYPQNILLLCGMSSGYEDKMHWWIPIEHRVKKLVHLHGISNNTDKLLLVFFSVNAYLNRDYSKSLWKRVFFNLKCLLAYSQEQALKQLISIETDPFWPFFGFNSRRLDKFVPKRRNLAHDTNLSNLQKMLI